MSELKKLWAKRNKLNLRIDLGIYKMTLVDQILLGHNRKRIKEIDRQINNFDPKRDEYNWEGYFKSLVIK